MAEIREKIHFDDTAVIKSLTDQYALVTKVNIAIRETEMGYKEAYDVAQKELEQTNALVKKGTAAIEKNIDETVKAKKASSDWGSSLKGVADEINIMGVNLGSVIGNLQAKQAAIRGVTGSLGGMVTGLRAVKVAIAATGIGLLIIALGSLIPLLTKSEKAADDMAGAMKTLGAMGDFVLPRIVNISKALGNFVTLNFKGAAEEWKKGVDGFGKGLSDAAAMGAMLARKLDEIQDLQREQQVLDAKDKILTADLLLQAQDRNKTLDERIKLLREVQKIEEDGAQRDFRLKQQLYLVENLRLKGKGDLVTEQEKENLAALKASALLAQANKDAVKFGEERKIQGFIQAEREAAEAAAKERLARIKEVNEALEKQVKMITDAADKVHDETLDPEQRILAEANVAKASIEEAFRALDEKAKAAGKEVDLAREKAALLLAIEKHTAREIEKVRNQGLEDIEDVAVKGLQTTERAAVDIVGNVQAAVKKMSDSPEVQGSLLTLSEKLQKAFDIDEDTLNAIVSGIGNVFDAVFDATNANTDAAIAKNDELLDSIRERQQLLDEDLDKEKERQDAGLANNLANKSKEREILAAEEAKALKEQEKLRKKQLAQQLLQDGIQQASSIASMAANVLASPGVSLLGPAGIPIAIATIAAFIGIISKIKSSSKKLYTGGPLDQEGVTGFVNKQGRSDRNGGRGHRVEDSNLVLGGKEFVVNENTSMRHADFLEALNRGEFDNSDGLHFAMGHHKELSHNTAVVGAIESRKASAGLAEAMERAIGRHIGGLAGVINSQEDNFAYRPGDIIVTKKNGKTTLKQTEADWRWKPEARG